MEMWAQVLGCPLQGELFHSYRNFDYNRSVCPPHGEVILEEWQVQDEGSQFVPSAGELFP